MKKFTKIMALFLALFMVFSVPVEAGAAARTTAVTNWKKAKTVKRGKTTVTLPKAKNYVVGYVKFKAPSTKTYKITFNNVRRYGKSSANDIISASAGIGTVDKYGSLDSLRFRQNKKTVETLWLCSQRSWQIGKTYIKKVASDTHIASRTVSLKLKKGQTIYIDFMNICKYKLSYDLTIK